jgi:hypothetical protein
MAHDPARSHSSRRDVNNHFCHRFSREIVLTGCAADAMQGDGRSYRGVADQLTRVPSLAMFVTVPAFNHLAVGLQDAPDLRLQQRALRPITSPACWGVAKW